MSSLSNTLLYIQQKTIQSISWIYIIFGITGCLLNILLFSQKQFRSISCCIYFLVASVVMLCQLSIYAIPSVYSFYYRNPLTYIVVYCKIRMFLVQTTNLTYRWAYTAASFDRYAMSSSNARLRALATVPIAIRVLVGIMLFWAIFSAYIIALYDIQSNTCGLFNNTTATLFTTLSSIIFGGIAPAVIMIVTTLLIRKNLREKRERRQILVNQRQASTTNKQLEQKRDQQAFKMLFTQIIVFIIVTIPWIAFNINNLISPYIPNKSADHVAIEGFISVISGALAFLFPTVSFYVYTLTSKMFRDALINILKSLVFCQFFNKHRIEPTTTNHHPQRAPITGS